MAMDHPFRIAVLGLGEAGSRIAADLSALGAAVTGYDPVAASSDATMGDVVAAADFVFALVPASAVEAAAADTAAAMAPGTLYADGAASGAAAKRAAAAHIAAAGGEFVDVALLGVVAVTGIRTPALLSGQGAGRAGSILSGFGMPVEVISDRPGDAAERKLLRSVFTKGLAAAIGESLEAARRLDCEEWLRGQIVDVLHGGAATVDRFEQGTRRHARRRVDEMAATLDLLEEQGLPAEITAATLARLARLAEAGETVE